MKRSFISIFLLLIFPACSSSSGPLPDNTSSLLLPFPQGQSYEVIQGFGGSYSHTGCAQYSVDFAMPEGSDIVSTASGTVINIKEDSDIGGADLAYINDANYIQVDQGEGVFGIYLHLCQGCVDVEPGDTVTQGQVIGRSGNTGFSGTPHLHYSVYSWATDCTVNFGFAEVSDADGIPLLGKTYTSSNDGSLDSEYTPSVIEAGAFSEDNVTLTSSLPMVLSKGETYTVMGSIHDGKTMVVLYLFSGATIVEDQLQNVEADGSFSLTYTPDVALTNGIYNLAMTTSSDGGYSAQTSRFVLVKD